ncbi:MAG TPA: benzoate-CoA ligase family protein [Polyangiaceae bacterium]|nr:benzoate-CoA ligase family protein [Polyangiaceae bacterium]
MMEVLFPEEFNLADYFLFDRLKDGKGTRVAVRFGARAWTYEDVADRTMRLAAALQAAGVRQEERVLVVLPDMPPFVWSIMATLKAGAVLAMGNPDAPAEDLAYLVEYTRPSAIITLARVVRDVEAVGSGLSASRHLHALFVVPDVATGDDPEESDAAASTLLTHCEGLTVTSLAAAIASAGRFAAVTTKRDDVAIWLFTSGSTGKSKAAIHTHRDFAFNTEAYAKGTVGYREGDVTVSVPRLFFGYATGTNLFFPFAVGGTTCLFAERPTPETLVAAILRHHPSVVTNVPTMIGKLLEYDAAMVAKGEAGLDLSSVRFSLSAGEALPPTLLQRYLERFGPGTACGGGEVYDGIGSAEMFHIYATNRPGDVKPGSLGRVVRGYQIAILPEDATGPGATPVPPGEIGVMWVRGDSVALAYHQDRDKSWRTFHGRWCCTGDLFRLDAEGYLWFSGRTDDLLKVSGLWVSPLEVEECLVKHPDVAMAAVIGADDGGLLKPKAYVVVREAAKNRGTTELAAELQMYVKDKLAKHKYPRWIVIVDDLPRNDRGKVDKKALKAREGVA